jgi:S1-C subfamily serine protease
MFREAFTWFALLGFIGTAQLAWTQTESPRQIARDAFPSVVLLLMQDEQGHPVSLGSGFAIREGLVVTNYHVVRGAASGYGRLAGNESKFRIAGTVAVDAEHDLAIVSLAGLKAPSLRLGDSSQVAVGDTVYAIGNPQGLEGTFSQGIVSAIRHVGADTLIQMTAPISPGSSGGAVLDAGGRVVGVAAATFQGGQNLNLAIPSSYLTALTSRISAELVPLTSTRSKPVGRSVLASVGNDITRGVLATKFLWEAPHEWDDKVYFTFSLQNQLPVDVSDVSCIVIFLDERGAPIDASHEWQQYAIQAGLGVRVRSIMGVDPSVRQLTRSIRIRVLDFKVVTGQQ